jgi:hypothetical protein
MSKIIYFASIIVVFFWNFYAVFCDTDRESNHVTGEESLSRLFLGAFA